MRIFFKYVSRCMLEKKGKLILLLLAIMVSTGLFISCYGAVDLAIDSIARPQLEAIENKDIYITSKDGESFFKADNINTDGIKDIVKEIQLGGYYENNDDLIDIQYIGRNTEDLSDVRLLEGSYSDLKDSSCVLSKRIIDEYNLKLNDTINVVIGGQSKKLKIVAIANNEGPVYNDTKESFTVLIPYEYIAKDMKAEGKYNTVLASATEDDIQDSIDTFNNNNKDYEAFKLFDRDAIKEMTSSFSSILYMMLIIVVAMSAIIIYSSIKLTIAERISVIGTFLSQGATTGTIKKILYMESIGYGIVGAIFGNAIGIGGLYFINYLVSPLKDYGIIEETNIRPSYIIAGCIFAILLSFISSIPPIRKIKKLQVKDVILNNVNVEYKISSTKFVIGLILLVGSIVINMFDGDFVNNISFILLFISITGIILMYPKVIDWCSRLLYKILRGHSKTSILAINNLKTSKILLGNITLIIISILSVILIISVASSITVSIDDAYEKMNFDGRIYGISTIRNSDKSSADEICDILVSKGVDKQKINQITYTNCEINEDSYSVEGINPNQYLDYNEYLDFSSDKDMYDKFTENNNMIIIADSTSKKLGKKAGDKVNIKINEVSKEYEIAGTINEKLYNNGKVIFIKNSSLAKDFNLKNSSEVIFSLDNKDIDEFFKEIKDQIRERGAVGQTKEEQLRINQEQNKTIITIMSVFSYMTVIIAALGVLNNIVIGFIQRKREFAMLSSVGMTNFNRNKMIILESVLSVFWSLLFAIPYSILGLSLITKSMITIDMPLEILLDYNSLLSISIISLIIILLATIPALLKSRKLSIIEELKYE